MKKKLDPTPTDNKNVLDVVNVAIIKVDCDACGSYFGVAKNFIDRRKEDGLLFYCPAGHSLFCPEGKKKKDEERLKEQQEKEAQERKLKKIADRLEAYEKRKSFWYQLRKRLGVV